MSEINDFFFKILQKLIFVTCITCHCTCANAQERSIGDSVPDIELNNVFNYKSEKFKIADFKGKLVILDFWSHLCISCLKSFPKLDSLQKKFDGKIQIILVNRESLDSTKRFFSIRKKIYLPDIPFVTSDTILNQFFPHQGVPFHVWINKNGIVQYTADGYNLTAQNIQDFINGKDLHLPKPSPIQYVETLFNEDWISSIRYHSYIANCINSGALHLSVSDEVNQFSNSDCSSVLQLYQMAFNESHIPNHYGFSRPGRTVLQVSDSSKYFRPKDPNKWKDWRENYTYYYHLLLPDSRKNEKFQIMREDLQRYFNLNAKVEKRPVKSLVLVRLGNDDKLKTKGGIPKNNFYPASERSKKFDSVRYMINKPFSTFSDRLLLLIEGFLLIPFADEAGYEGNIDIQVEAKVLDNISVEGLRKELRKYGLDLVEKEKVVDVLILRERVHQHLTE